MKIILGGHWTIPPPGWTTLRESDQDITRPLAYQTESIDVVFTEHVVEHVSFGDAIGFFKESLRVLKKGGVFRTVAPMVETMFRFVNDERGRRYAYDSILPFYASEAEVLRGLGIGLDFDVRPFLIDSMVRKHQHKFCWSERLLCEVLLKLGFSMAASASPGKSRFNPDSAIERTIRGVHAENLVRDCGPQVYDPESGIVEALK